MAAVPYSYLNEEVVNNFGGSGSETLIEILENLEEADEESVVSQLFTELLLVYEDENLDLDSLVQFLFAAVKNDLVARIFCQVLNVFPPNDNIQKLLLLLSRKDNVIRSDTMALYISPDLLKELGVVPKDVLTKSLNGRIRDEFYTQKKYNLLHEETEGYSKLIIELYTIFKYDETSFQLGYASQIIEKLIGHYSLDPNRCLDVVLEVLGSSFVSKPELAIKLLKSSRWWPLIDSDCSSINSLSIGGSETASKILGLKLLKYPAEKDLPETLKIFITCLIKEGFLSFGSMWPYLSPTDQEMEDLEVEYKKKLEEEVSKAGASALALAAPLAEEEEDSKTTSSGQTPNPKTTVPLSKKVQSNMKYQFLKAFLGNGLYWPSIFILAKHPFLVHIDEEAAPLINRLFDAMINPLYSSIRPFTDGELAELQTSKQVAFPRPHNHVVYEDYPCTELLSFKPTIKSYSQKKFIYFYTSWNTKIPQIIDVETLFRISKEFLKYNGVKLASDIELFLKICKIGVWDLTNNHDETRKSEWFHYFRNFIFPAMSYIEENSIVIDEAFSILSFYSIEDRFSVYGELYQVLAKNNPFIKIAYGKAEKSTKDILKRLSKENVRPMMRRLAKISFSNPLPCLLTILQQIESYDNLNTLVVETARYFNKYGWDILTAAILMRLTNSGRSNMQENGINERQWIQSLASFIGKICQRYPNAIDLSTIISFLLKLFHNGEHYGLIVLKEIFISMGGIQTITNLTVQQINMINCGSSLEMVVYRTIDDLRFDRFNSGTVLVKTFLKLDAVNELLVLLRQTSEEILYNSKLSHLKILASKSDDLDTVIHLFTTLINFFGSPEDFEGILLSVSDLAYKFHIPPQWSFELWRPILGKKLKDISYDGIWVPALEVIMNDFSKIIGDSLDFLTPGLFVTFWQLSLYDVNYSDELYDDEKLKLESGLKSLRESIAINSRDKDISKLVLDKSRKTLSQNEEFIKKIPQDKEAHSKHHQFISTRLQREAPHWFTAETLHSQAKQLLQFCILPRAIHSSFDAVYTARFLFKLHELQTPNFSLIILLDELINSRLLFGTLFTSTPTESENLGLFFADVLKRLHNWTNKGVFEEQKRVLYDSQLQEIDFDGFRKILFDYHSIILQDVGVALGVHEYMARRNGITFLKNLLGVYPNVEDHCEQIVKCIEHISSTEQREDLKLSSSALIGHVKSRSKTWVHMWDFISMSEEEKSTLQAKRKEQKQKEEAIIRAEKELITKKQKEREDLVRKERENEEQLKRQKVINYDSQAAVSSRGESRGTISSRGRYDNYSKYNKMEKDSPKPEEKPAKEVSTKPLDQKQSDTKAEKPERSTTPQVQSKSKDEIEAIKREIAEKKRLREERNKLDQERKEKSAREKDSGREKDTEKGTQPAKESTKEPKESKESKEPKDEAKKPDLKSKIMKAKRDFQEKNALETRARTPVISDSRDKKHPLEPVRMASQRDVTPVERAQAPVPPPEKKVAESIRSKQPLPSQDRYSKHSDSRYNRSNDGYYQNRQNQRPLAPPPRAPVDSRGHNRTDDSRGSRPSDSRARPADSRPAPNRSDDGRSSDSRSAPNRTDDSKSSETTPRPEARDSTNSKSKLPPPPPPPISLKSRNNYNRQGSNYGSNGYRDGYNESRDNREYKGKRQYDYNSSGRYDKKPRY